MANNFACCLLLMLFVSTDCANVSTCMESQFAFRLSNTDIKTNKCYEANNLDDMVWVSGCNNNVICRDTHKHAFLTIEAVDKDYLLWPNTIEKILLHSFNKLVLHNKYSSLNTPYRMFFMSHRRNSAKYIRSNDINNDMLYGTIHMTLKYLCCYTENELQQIIQLLKTFQWESFQITLKKMICLYGGNQIHFPFVFEKESQIQLKKWTFHFEKYMEKNRMKVKQCRKDFEPFHTSFLSIKYYNNELIQNKENILNTAVRYIQEINNYIIDGDYDLAVNFDKETIINNLLIAAKSNDVFDFNNQSYIRVSTLPY
eukprot:385511_1